MSERAAAADAPQSLAAQGGVVASMTGLSRVTGFARDIVLSHFLGAAGVADAFFVAFRIPNTFRRLFAEGAFAQAFVPVLAEYRAGERRALEAFVSRVAGNLALTLGVVTVLGIFGAQGLVLLFAPGFVGDAGRFALAVEMARITFPYLAFISLTAFAGALLNSFNRFALPAFTPVLLNAALIFSALVAASAFETPAMALAWGVVFAGAAQLLLQLPALRALGLLRLPRVSFGDPGVRKMGRLLVPAVFAASVNQINGLVGGILASLLATGSISWLYYADRLMELPVGLVAVALGTVLLPSLSRLHVKEDQAGFAATLDWGFRMGLLLGLPAATALFVLALPLNATIYQHGAFTAADAAMAGLALQAFAAGLPAHVLAKVAAPGYFARQNTRSPFHFALAAAVVNCAFGIATFRWLGHVGLALAVSVAALVNAGLLMGGLLRRGDFAPTPRLWRTLGAATGASAAMAAGLVWLVPGDEWWRHATLAARVGALAGAVGGGALAYFAVVFALGARPRDFRHRV